MNILSKKEKSAFWVITAGLLLLASYHYFFGSIEPLKGFPLFPEQFRKPWLTLGLIAAASFWLSIDKWHTRDSLNRFAGACIAIFAAGIFINALLVIVFSWAARTAMNGADRCA